MRTYEVRYLDNSKVQLVYSSFGEVKRVVTIKVGDSFYVQPDNPKKLLHRGRHCIIKDFQKDDIGNPSQVIVTFSDNGRSGKVDIQDLVVTPKTAEDLIQPSPQNDLPRFLPEEVPGDLLTRNELKSMGRKPVRNCSAYVVYREQPNEFELYHIDDSIETKKQSGFSIVRKDFTLTEVLEKRQRALRVRRKQLPPQ
ncbi:hypothetical protein [Paenibacillus lentus]|uniref:Uncharacterized protein n=1 Tax=Paenibacillus lentus TaxID=1338368 RepID=A0A3S8RXH4_9BACL|nr:hypothetical protein [Paenibacillus lentus]AZK47503.1 hypothetical protein EIM92_16210 [Paenibacillus lentus]